MKSIIVNIDQLIDKDWLKKELPYLFDKYYVLLYTNQSGLHFDIVCSIEAKTGMCGCNITTISKGFINRKLAFNKSVDIKDIMFDYLDLIHYQYNRNDIVVEEDKEVRQKFINRGVKRAIRPMFLPSI